MTTPTPTPTPERIATIAKQVRDWAHSGRETRDRELTEGADLIEALDAQLVETRRQLLWLHDQLVDALNGQTEAEAAAASVRETALEDACEAVRKLSPRGAGRIIQTILALKSTPPAPVTPSATKEVMPDTERTSRPVTDTATPQASTLAPGADALIDRNALIDLLAKIEDGPYLGAEGVADAVIELLLPNLTRAQGGKP